MSKLGESYALSAGAACIDEPSYVLKVKFDFYKCGFFLGSLKPFIFLYKMDGNCVSETGQKGNLSAIHSLPLETFHLLIIDIPLEK